ncbi:DUF1659 domain-containing protein [Metabacillus litoralis]|uniref:DUF1659 domain-containing protein n=1 Tax=Metabacillus litoralis TaxID=152268 RepID=UPI00203C09A3|nr:DUF1659 domain-containing protein [Metabacillus litoralis]MCM3409975.1 DUF1659 domain-containing protein [Metabacillus litoralis]
MANQVILDSNLSLIYDMGMDINGKPITKRKSYNNVKTSATPDQLLQVAQAIASLQTETLTLVERSDAHQLTV